MYALQPACLSSIPMSSNAEDFKAVFEAFLLEAQPLN